MIVILPLSQCCSYPKRDQFLSLLSPISKYAISNEPNCVAYAWFISPSTTTNTQIPNHYVRGLEVYESENDLVVTHRASDEYKIMRGSVIPEGIMERPSDLRFLRPTGVGWLNREGGGEERTVYSEGSEGAEKGKEWVVVLEFQPEVGKKESVRQGIEKLFKSVENDENVLSFWELEYFEDSADEGLKVFSRFRNENSYQKHFQSAKYAEIINNISSLATIRTTIWTESGIGFIGR